MTKNSDEDYDLKDFILYRFGYDSPKDVISKRLTGSGGSEISNQSPKEIFEDYRVEKRHKEELENLIADARKRSEAKDDKKNEAPKVLKDSEISKNDEKRNAINESSSPDKSLTKTSSHISISSQGSSVEIIEPAAKIDQPTDSSGVVHANLVTVVQAPKSLKTPSPPSKLQSDPKPEESIPSAKPRSLMPSRKSKLIFDGLKSDPKAFRKMIKKSNSSENQETSKSVLTAQPTSTPSSMTQPTQNTALKPVLDKSMDVERLPETPNKPNERSESEWSKMVRQQMNIDTDEQPENELVIGIDQSGSRKVKCAQADKVQDKIEEPSNSPVQEGPKCPLGGLWKPVRTSPERTIIVTENLPIRKLLIDKDDEPEPKNIIEKPMEMSTPPRKIILPGSLGELVTEPKPLSICVHKDREESTDDRINDPKIKENPREKSKSTSPVEDIPGEPVYSTDDQSEKPWLENISVAKTNTKPKKSKKSKKDKKSKKSKERRIVKSAQDRSDIDQPDSTSGSEVIPDDEEDIILVPDEEENDELEVEIVTSESLRSRLTMRLDDHSPKKSPIKKRLSSKDSPQKSLKSTDRDKVRDKSRNRSKSQDRSKSRERSKSRGRSRSRDRSSEGRSDSPPLIVKRRPLNKSSRRSHSKDKSESRKKSKKESKRKSRSRSRTPSKSRSSKKSKSPRDKSPRRHRSKSPEKSKKDSRKNRDRSKSPKGFRIEKKWVEKPKVESVPILKDTRIKRTVSPSRLHTRDSTPPIENKTSTSEENSRPTSSLSSRLKVSNVKRRIIITQSSSQEASTSDRKKSEDKPEDQENGDELGQFPELSDLIGQTENDLGSSSDSSIKKKPIFGSKESKIKNHPFLGKYLVNKDIGTERSEFTGASLKNSAKDNKDKLVIVKE